MPKLFCIVVGHVGSPFPVDVAADETVGDLKQLVKEKKPQSITCDADRLELYMALNGLSRDEAKAATLDDDGKVPGCIKMDELLRIQNNYHFGMNFQPEEGKIYVLVVVPAESHPSKNQRVNVGLRELAVGRLKRQKLVPVPRSEWFASDFKQVAVPLPSSPFYTPLFDAITMEDWLEMTYNGSVLNLQMDDDQLSLQETRKRAGFKCFDMTFPLLIRESQKRRSETAKQDVFVRPCYETLFDLLLKNINNYDQSVAITGNPGIGKRQFYAYCAFRLSKEPLIGRTLIVNSDTRYCAFVDGKFESLLSVEQVAWYQRNRNVVRLIDGRSDLLFGWSGVSILFTSPGCPDYNEFVKASHVEYVMPPWTHKELIIAASVVEVPVADIQRRSSIFGGIARYVFSPNAQDLESFVTESIKKVNVLHLFGAVSDRAKVCEKYYSHWLLLMYPQHAKGGPYKGFYLDFTSEQTANRLYDRMVDNSYDKLTEFIVANAEDANSGGFRGTLFHIFCHRKWSRPGAVLLKGRALLQEEDSDEDEDSEEGEAMLIDVPDEVETFRFVELTDIPVFTEDKKVYCRPIGKTYPWIDAIYWSGETCYLLQMTISKKRGIVHAPLVKILDWCADNWPVAFVFVVPVAKVGRYKRQNLLTSTGTVYKNPSTKARELKQYVVGVDVIPSRS